MTCARRRRKKKRKKEREERRWSLSVRKKWTLPRLWSVNVTHLPKVSPPSGGGFCRRRDAGAAERQGFPISTARILGVEEEEVERHRCLYYNICLAVLPSVSHSIFLFISLLLLHFPSHLPYPPFLFRSLSRSLSLTPCTFHSVSVSVCCMLEGKRG